MASANFKFTTVSFEEAKAKSAGSPKTNTTAASNSADSSQKADSFTALSSGDCTNPSVRVEWRRMTDQQRDNFVNAVKCLLAVPSGGAEYTGSRSRYEDLVSVHQKASPNIHMNPQFYPWHRYFLAKFEQMIREECAYVDPFPWWDETQDSGNFAASPVFGDRWFGAAPSPVACITNGAFANQIVHIGPNDQISDQCLHRGIDEAATRETNGDFVRFCNSHAGFNDMVQCAESGPHAFGHNGIGGLMSDVAASPGDPLFFLHHAFIDRNWRAWQVADPAARMREAGGLPLEQVLSIMNIRPDTTVSDVMDTTAGYLCYTYDSEQV